MKETEKNVKNNEIGKGGGLRYNQDKLRYDLVHPKAHEDMVAVLTDGAKKYFERNWELGMPWTTIIASLKRHLAAIERGEDYDSESGRLHVAHAACNIHFLNAYYYIYPQGDNRPKNFLNKLKIGLDIDGVIADFAKAWHQKFPDISETPNSWYFDFNIKERFENMKINGELDDFYLNIPSLYNPKEIPFDPHCYITSRPVNKEITEKWLQINGYPIRPVYSLDICTSKVIAAKDAGVEIFIDDSYENFVELNNENIFTYLYNAPWNEKFNVGHMRINSLKNIPLLQ
ncbi:MAG: dATP/dGTP diphosphohydrolase domain-containing protein [bacterium]